jgi:nicotinamidase-related amidase
MTPPPLTPDPRHRIALILVDVNRSFFDPSGSLYYPAAADVLQPLEELLRAARAGGRLVVHAREIHHPGLYDFELAKLPAHCRRDARDAEPFPGFEEGEGEVLVPKRRYSAFFATDLALLLREQAVEQVVVAGVKTNVCIRATVQDAFAHGFRPIVPRQAVNSNRPHLHAAALEDIERYFGEVTDLEAAVQLLCGVPGSPGTEAGSYRVSDA